MIYDTKNLVETLVKLEEFFFLKLGEYDSILSAKMIANLSSRSVIFSALALSAHQ